MKTLAFFLLLVVFAGRSFGDDVVLFPKISTDGTYISSGKSGVNFVFDPKTGSIKKVLITSEGKMFNIPFPSKTNTLPYSVSVGAVMPQKFMSHEISLQEWIVFIRQFWPFVFI